MTLCGKFFWAPLATVILGCTLSSGRAATTNAPDFKEVYDLLRLHLAGVTDPNLKAAAVTGLLSELNGRASLVNASATAVSTPRVKAILLDQSILYLQVNGVADGLAAKLRLARETVSASNKLAGLILDLRFTPGDGYATVKDSLDALVPAKIPLLVLINNATQGAAEVLAAQLHEDGALLLGNPTAGAALTTEDFPLANGQQLRIATKPVLLHGTAMTQVQPDITVRVALADEHAYMANPYGTPTGADSPAYAATNDLASLLDHTSEADLVRQKRKDGDGDENPEPPPARTEPSQPVLRDPVLVRALDLIEGLAVLRQSHS